MTIVITDSKNPKFVSFNVLDSDVKLDKKIQFDCSLMSKEYRLIKGFYSFQIGPAIHLDDSVVALFFKHSLMCACYQALNEELSIV
jgi:hypothetical protein